MIIFNHLFFYNQKFNKNEKLIHNMKISGDAGG